MTQRGVAYPLAAALLTLVLALFATPTASGNPLAPEAPPTTRGNNRTTAPAAQPPAARMLGTRLSVTATPQSGTVTIGGTLVDATGKGVGGAAIQLAIDGGGVPGATTGGDGNFSVRIPAPAAGQHTVTAGYSGDPSHAPSTAAAPFTVGAAAAPATTAQPAAAVMTTTLTGSLTPNPVAANGVVQVTGRLVTSTNVPVDRARVDLALNYAGITGVAVTGADGTFSQSFVLPDPPQPGLPAQLTVNATYAGDSRFPATTAAFSVPLSAAVTQTVQTPTIATPTPVPSQASSSARSTTSTGPIAGVGDMGAGMSSLNRILVGVIAAVALAGIAALGIMFFLARRRAGLERGERRGFGSDFGRR